MQSAYITALSLYSQLYNEAKQKEKFKIQIIKFNTCIFMNPSKTQIQLHVHQKRELSLSIAAKHQCPQRPAALEAQLQVTDGLLRL